MAVTKGTWNGGINPLFNIDLGVSEKINQLTGGYLNRFGSLFVNPNQPQPQQSVQQTPPQQQNQQQSGLGAATSLVNNPTVKKTVAVPVTTPTNANPNPTPDMGGIDQQLQDQINNLYGANNSLFDRQQSNLGEQRTLAMGDVNRQGAEAQTSMDSALQQAVSMLNSSKNDTALSQRGAEAQNTRQYQALNQQYQNRYGGGTSAGGALSELVATEYQRQAGNIRGAYNTSMDNIYKYEANAQSTYQQGIQQLNNDKLAQIGVIDQDFNAGLLKIDSQRATNEQGKSQAKIDLLVQAQNAAQAIKDYSDKKSIDYQYYLSEEKQKVADALAYNQQMAKLAHDNAFTAQQNIANIPNQGSNAPGQGQGQIINAPGQSQSINSYNLGGLDQTDNTDMQYLNPFDK